MGRHHLVAKAYDKRGKLLSSGENSYAKTHPLQDKFSKLAGNANRPFLHAEIAALLKAGTQPVHTLTIERYKKDGSPGNAMPCRACALAIKWWGVQHVSYTVG